MLFEVLAVAGVGAVTYTILDHENVLPWSAMPNGSKKFWWEKQPFVQPPAATFARPTMLRPTPQTPEQKIKMAQNSMANSQRQIAEATREQMQQTYYVPGQLGKYSLSTSKW